MAWRGVRWRSIQFHRSTGCFESSALKGCVGTLLQSLKKILRWRFMLSGIEVHSYLVTRPLCRK